MNSAEKQAVLHCLKSTIDEEVCEECPLYGTTGTDHCERDCVRLAINALEQEPCVDAISREDALQALCKAVHKNDDTIPCLNQRVSCLWNKTKVQDYAEEILKLPPVKPAEKVGHWIIYDVHGHKACKCSECNNDVGYPCTDKYCKYCGAKM